MILIVFVNNNISKKNIYHKGCPLSIKYQVVEFKATVSASEPLNTFMLERNGYVPGWGRTTLQLLFMQHLKF